MDIEELRARADARLRWELERALNTLDDLDAMETQSGPAPDGEVIEYNPGEIVRVPLVRLVAQIVPALDAGAIQYDEEGRPFNVNDWIEERARRATTEKE